MYYSGKTTKSLILVWSKVTASVYSITTAQCNHFFLMMHIFSKTTNDVGVLKQETGKQQQYIGNGFTLSSEMRA